MFSNVDLPDPEVPDRDKLTFANLERDVIEGRHAVRAHLIDFETS